MAFATKIEGTVLHFTGHRADAPGRRPPRLDGPLMEEASAWIAGELASLKPLAAFGALASGADILFAEAILRVGATLHVVLPLPPDEFQRLSVDGAVDDWRPRFAACWQAATSHRVPSAKSIGQDDLTIGFASQVAMGLALLEADRLAAKAAQLLIWDGKAAQGPAGTGADAAAWQLSGAEQRAFALTPPHLAPPQDLPLVYRVSGETARFSARLEDALQLAREEQEKRAVILEVALRADDLGALPTGDLSAGTYANENAAALARLHLASRLALLPAKGQLYRIETK